MAVATASVPPPQLDDTEQHEQQQPFTVKFDLPLMSRYLYVPVFLTPLTCPPPPTGSSSTAT